MSIPGASQGFGRILTGLALARGDRVIAAARHHEKIKDLESEACQTLQLDVTDGFEIIQAKAQQAMDVWGRVDVLVNNAGKLQVACLRLFFMFHTHSVVLSRLLPGYVEVTTQESSTSVPISILHF